MTIATSRRARSRVMRAAPPIFAALAMTILPGVGPVHEASTLSSAARAASHGSKARDSSSVIRIGPRRPARPPVADGVVESPDPVPASEGELPAAGEDGIVVVRQDVRDLIEQVTSFYGFDANLTRQVRGEVENLRLPADLDGFLKRLADERDLVFYFRGRELNGSARDENVRRVIGLGPSDIRELRGAVEAAGVDADRFALESIEASNSVLVSGPPSFVGLVEVLAESLVRTERVAPEVTVIRGNRINRSETGNTAETAPATPEGDGN